jgi:hypothetical protein
MDKDNYKNMDQEELENLQAHLTNILVEREKIIIAALESRNLNDLKDALKDNKKKILSINAWKSISFQKMTEKDLDFFLYVRDLPNYSKYEQGKCISDLTKTEEALTEAMYNKSLFDAFMKHPELSVELKENIEQFAIRDDIPLEIIKQMFKKKLIKPTLEFRDEIIEGHYDNYLLYFLTEGKPPLKQNEFRRVYLNNWKSINNNPILEIVKNKYPEYKNISLDSLLNSLDIISIGGPITTRYRHFLNLNETVFISALENHPFTKTNVIYLLECLDENPIQFNDKFTKFVNLIIEKFPEHIDSLKAGKKVVQSEEFKPIFEKLINFAELNIEIGKKGITPKKLKM